MSALARRDGLRMLWWWTERPSGVQDHYWYLQGTAGTVQFRATRYVSGPLRARALAERPDWFQILGGDPWMALDLGYHSPTPRYEGQDVFMEDCPVLGGRCYYDGSGLQAEEVLYGLTSAPTAPAMWPWIGRELHAYYRRCFGAPGEFYANPITELVALLRAAGAR